MEVSADRVISRLKTQIADLSVQAAQYAALSDSLLEENGQLKSELESQRALAIDNHARS